MHTLPAPDAIKHLEIKSVPKPLAIANVEELWRRQVARDERIEMPQLQEQGAELVVELLEAADNVGHLLPDEIVALLREAAGILDGLLDSDVPTDDG